MLLEKESWRQKRKDMRVQIKEIQIVPIKPINGLVGFASFVLDKLFYFGSIGIYTRPNGGYRLTYPTKKVGNNSVGIFYPINKQIAEDIEDVIISEFEKVTKTYDRHNQINIR